MIHRVYIYNACILLPERIVKGHILIEGERISEISETGLAKPNAYPDAFAIDAQGCYVMPGIIDIHSDAIEKEMQPRPNTLFPVDMAFYELEKKLAAGGITTMYHSLSWSDDWGVRDQATVLSIIKRINLLKRIRSMINHRVHLRYEITYLDGLNELENLIRERKIDFMSYMDHTPGQGQFKDTEAFIHFTTQAYGKDEKEAGALVDKAIQCQTMVDLSKLVYLAQLAKGNGIRLASHDDDTKEKIEAMLSCEGVVSEFPINLETALFAKTKGMSVCVGAPNIIRGKSHSNNLRAIDAIQHDAADIICSDYMPSAILPAIFHLTREGISLPQSVRMATLNPAEALGIDHAAGSIEVGKYADLILVELYEGYPLLRQTMVRGRSVYRSDYHDFNGERVDDAC